MGKPILMGRKTYESIGKPLPGRRNIIISRNPDYRIEGCETTDSLDSALKLLHGKSEAMLIGGASLYHQFLYRVDTLYLTQIHACFEGNAWFPELDTEIWVESWRKDHKADEENSYDYSFVKYSRR